MADLSRRARILVIEDDPIIALTLRLLLTQLVAFRDRSLHDRHTGAEGYVRCADRPRSTRPAVR